MTRRTLRHASVFCLPLLIGLGASDVSATNVSFLSIDLDLDDPSTGNNSFETVFRVTDTVTGISIDGGPVNVDYIDENNRGMQVDLDIDFGDPLAPVVNSIEFVGQPGDISHVFVGGPIDVQFDNGLVNIDLDAVPNGVKGFLRTQGGPIPVSPDGSFESGNTNLVARQGTVDIDGTITSFLGTLLVDETFSLADTPLDQFNDSISAGSVNSVTVDFVGVDAGDRVYGVTVATVLQNTQLPFSAGDFELALDITGTLLGRGEIRLPGVPEPTTAVLLVFVIGLAPLARSRGELS